MKNKNFKGKYIIGALILGLVGVLMLFLCELIGDGIIKNLVSEIGSAILISGILGIIDEYVLKEGLVELILEKINIRDEVNKTGLEEIVSGITEINYKYYFKNAKKNIDIIHIYGRTWTNNNIDEITDRILRTNCKVRVILVNPESKFVPGLEEHFQYESGKLKTLITDVSKVWKSKYDKKLLQKKRSTQGSIKLYYHNGQPTNSMYRIDDRIIIVQTKTTQEKTTRMPAIIFRDTNKEDCFYNIYLKEIEQLVKESKEIDFNNI
ncbi:hypothetical protein [Clostridium butyricum]|uniref:hypothetical protein n=1 Tax=Clostridium butyricum TaxID=1492 RepID=UPI0021085F82|nr:hypothetical protein [Clostridium butyricum]MCQ2014666.1 hypothetical protein [Clostridium butyricum]MCQ2026567.1 hypothetical protein [Clostridium butyricum]